MTVWGEGEHVCLCCQLAVQPLLCSWRLTAAGRMLATANDVSACAGTEAARLAAHFGPVFQHRDTSGYQLMVDWVNPYNNGAHSTGIIAVRCTDVSKRDKGKSEFCRILAIIPGPTAPDNLTPYLMRTPAGFQGVLALAAVSKEGVAMAQLCGTYYSCPACRRDHSMLLPKETTACCRDHHMPPPSICRVSPHRKGGCA